MMSRTVRLIARSLRPRQRGDHVGGDDAVGAVGLGGEPARAQVRVDAGARGVLGLGAAGEQRGDDAGEDVAGAGRGERRARRRGRSRRGRRARRTSVSSPLRTTIALRVLARPRGRRRAGAP